MSDTSATASVQIDEPVTSSVSKHVYKVSLKDGDGQPVTGEELTISMTGSGGFAPSFHSDEIKRTTDEAGEAEFTWYRRGIFTRGVKATVSVTASSSDRTVTVERVTETGPDLEISYVRQEIRISPPRV